MLVHAIGTIPPEADIQPLVPAEIDAVRALHRAGVLLHTFVRADTRGAFFIVQADDVQAAAGHLHDLPLVRHDLMTLQYAEVLPSPSAQRHRSRVHATPTDASGDG